MRRTLIAMAAISVASAASAQSSVTLFGVVDAAFSSYKSKSADILGSSATAKRTVLSNSGYNASRLGFRGTEDLGGGLAASFWLEAPITVDDGQTGVSTFSRRSTLSISGALGELRLGRDYTPSFWNDIVFDPFGPNGVGTSLITTAHGFNTSGAAASGFAANANYVRASNSIGYFLPPNLGGFYGQAMYAFHEKEKFVPGTATPNAPNGSRTGRYVGGRVGYLGGPLDVAVAYGSSTIADAFNAGLTTNLNTFNVGASYDFGLVKLSGEYSKAKVDSDIDGVLPAGASNLNPSAEGWLVAATAPVGAGLIRMAFSAVKLATNRTVPQVNGDSKADKFALGYVHNLSKRTALYATVARLNNKNGYDLLVGGPNYVSKVSGVPGIYTPKSSTGYDFGIRHAF